MSLLANEVEVRQALKYLVSHAVKVSGEGTTVRVRGSILERTVSLGHASPPATTAMIMMS